ncbi:hypothetical protein EDB83DRAFT_2324123 [Lactarius deliciosus]|nr:hypothetical protein EDB83DRAFT_2324123 [Lactarius deliciosus]
MHFHLVEYAYWDLQLARRVPSIIFVWARGQVFWLHKALTRFEPEVALAIAPGSEPPYHDDPPEGPDSYLADHGGDDRQNTDTDTADGEGDGDPVPGLPCVIDRSAPPCGLLWSVAGGTAAAAAHAKGLAAPFGTHRGSFFPPEHGFEDADADPRTLVGRGERGARAPFDLADILTSLQSMREVVAGIENEAQRRAATARFAVFQRMGVDGLKHTNPSSIT